MRTSGNHKQHKYWLLLLILLALLCIGCAELIACAFFAPVTFERLTAPIRTSASAAAEKGHSLVLELSSHYEQLLEWRESLSTKNADPQDASEPTDENPAPVLDPAITELIVGEESVTLTGGIFPVIFYNQGDKTWADQPYGTDNIGQYGCGPTVMAMAVQTLTGEPTDPAQMAQEAVDAGYWARKQGSYLSIICGLSEDYGIVAAALKDKTPDGITDALLSGKMLVALMGPGHFTTSGHFILIRGVTLQGTLLIADPNSTERSLQEWDAQLILDELSTSTAHGAPLWTLAYPN